MTERFSEAEREKWLSEAELEKWLAYYDDDCMSAISKALVELRERRAAERDIKRAAYEDCAKICGALIDDINACDRGETFQEDQRTILVACAARIREAAAKLESSEANSNPLIASLKNMSPKDVEFFDKLAAMDAADDLSKLGE